MLEEYVFQNTYIDETGFCLGDFEGSELSSDYGCTDFPVRGTDNFFSFSFGIASELLAGVCPLQYADEGPQLYHFCVIYGDCDGGKTMGLSLNI